MPPNLADGGPQAGDERFVTYTARRTTFEQVLGKAAEGEPGVEVRRGAAVKELTMQVGNGTPHVTGVRLRLGRDAAGRPRGRRDGPDARSCRGG